MEFISKLPTPQEIKTQYSVPEKSLLLKKQRQQEIEDIFTGKDNRKILIIGPCSADNEESVLEYLSRLHKIEEQVKDKLLFVPRIYTNKPRTLGIGYKGMSYSPDPSEKPNLTKGLITIRKLHMRALTEYGFSCADEMLYPQNHSYLDDLLVYVAVGARSVENQQHRLTASGVGIPVGMKNPTSGDISVMINAIYAAQQPQMFEYRGWECKSAGNPLTHAILRGFVNRYGQSTPNYHYEDLIALFETYADSNLLNPAVIVDTNHSNSNKNFLEQIRIAKEVLHSCRYSTDVNSLVKGFMIESYLEDGSQNIGENIYGKSITDPCLGWDKSEQLILDIAELL
ncbi:MAG: 3-deoxy-7-phosphoheptulonate synthase [Clostridiaceae bacterium]|jgi:3-deoxy-7-phosphoheptulonate synthase|nr:3-deoxy-7-phosphoheptulonate synthase [Bacillota bacterium]NLN51412.1 3-deoxy-7-phosphoheptulonate synthase [Clostridiaceae bacterium]